MEPEQLKTLREKIIRHESQPVLWKKEFVWQQVIDKPGFRPVKVQWHYVAALLLTGMIGFLIHFYQQWVWESASKRISLLEKRIITEENKIVNLNRDEEICVIENNTNTLRASTSYKTNTTILVEPQLVIEQEPLAIEGIDSFIATEISESVVVADEKPPLKMIVPIIGKIPMDNPELAGKERTVRIRLNKKDNPELASLQETQHGLLAKIN